MTASNSLNSIRNYNRFRVGTCTVRVKYSACNTLTRATSFINTRGVWCHTSFERMRTAFYEFIVNDRKSRHQKILLSIKRRSIHKRARNRVLSSNIVLHSMCAPIHRWSTFPVPPFTRRSNSKIPCVINCVRRTFVWKAYKADSR